MPRATFQRRSKSTLALASSSETPRRSVAGAPSRAGQRRDARATVIEAVEVGEVLVADEFRPMQGHESVERAPTHMIQIEIPPSIRGRPLPRHHTHPSPLRRGEYTQVTPNRAFRPRWKRGMVCHLHEPWTSVILGGARNLRSDGIPVQHPTARRQDGSSTSRISWLGARSATARRAKHRFGPT